MKTLPVVLGYLVLASFTPGPLWAWSGQLSSQLSSTQAATPVVPLGPDIQTQFERLLTQGLVTDQEMPSPFWQFALTGWGSWDTLPSGNPEVLSSSKGTASSRLLQGFLTWIPFPGQFQIQAGKILLSPSVGFFRTPLNFFQHPATAPSLDGASQGPWQEGYWGVNSQVFWSNASASLWLSPRLSWDDTANQALQFITLPQNLWRSEVNLSWNWGNTSVQMLAEAETPGDAGSTVFHYGASLDAALNDAWTIKAEGRADTPLTGSVQTQGLAGLAWSPAERLSVTVEAATDPTGLHGFVRCTFPVDSKVDAILYTVPSLEDESGIAGGELKASYDSWGWNVWAQVPWGMSGTEQGNTNWRGTWGATADLYF